MRLLRQVLTKAFDKLRLTADNLTQIYKTFIDKGLWFEAHQQNGSIL